MINVTEAFKRNMLKPIKEIDAYIEHGEDRITAQTDLVSIKISCEAGMCKTAMKKFEAKLIGNYDLLGQYVNVGFGVRIEDNTFEYMDYGSFLITEVTTVKDTGVTTIKGYDKMIETMVEYRAENNIEYPISLYDYTQAICLKCGLELVNDSLVNGDWLITKELWENISGITYRDILQQIAQATASTCIVDNNDRICFKYIEDTGEEITYDNLIKLSLKPKYGEINSVVLARAPQEDNIYLKDDASIENNGLTEFRIENNEIVDKDRENAIVPIYNELAGIYYYPFEVTTTGTGWYEIGDSFDIINDQNQHIKCVLFNFSITIDGAIKEVLKTEEENKTQTQYQYATSIAKRLKNTEIIVNKQEQYIEQLVTDMYEEDGIVHENFTNVYQDIENIINSVQHSGGSNLIKNSVMFGYDSQGNPTDWTVTGAGTLEINSSAESMTNGALSGHVFKLNNKKVKQRVYVKANTDPEDKTYYAFSTKIKKNASGTCYVKIFNSNEEYIINIPNGEDAFWKEFEIKELLPTENYYDIEFYGSAESGATFTDNMFNVGEYKSPWQQASGEIMNTQVNVNVDGVIVRSSVYLGDYTIMSPLEFAGYSNIEGTITKVFTINKDTTEVEKIYAKKGISMPPLKIVPVTTGEKQGWAFVPYTN